MTAIESGFELDLRRSITLGLYIKHWGIPHQRYTSNPARLGGQTVEVYDFQRAEPREVRRVATVGLAAAGSDKRSWELMFALPQDLAEASWEEVASYLLDVAVYSIATHPTSAPGTVTDPSPLAPSAWGERGVLIAHAISEDEELAAGWHVVRSTWTSTGSCPCSDRRSRPFARTGSRGSMTPWSAASGAQSTPSVRRSLERRPVPARRRR